MTPEQMKDEIKGVVQIFDEIYSTFALSYKIELSTMPEDHMGDEETWRMAEATLKAAIEELGKPYEINEGDGAFYGPKLDFHLSDSNGRTWQCGTIQLDFQMCIRDRPRAYAKAILRDESMHDRCPSGQGIGITADFLKMIKAKGISPKVVGVEVINDEILSKGRCV